MGKNLSDYLYYEEKNPDIKIFCGDCLEIMPLLEKVDLVVTDPPYGISDIWKGGFSSAHGWSKAKIEDVDRSEWDSKAPRKEFFDNLLKMANNFVIWGGNYFDLPKSRGWIVWNKPERNFSLGEAELAWTSKDTVIRVFDEVRSEVGRQHPTQKPIGAMRRSIKQFDCLGTVLDPFLGSGTTLVACKELNRNGIGIEINPKYCEVAKKRLQNTQRMMI